MVDAPDRAESQSLDSVIKRFKEAWQNRHNGAFTQQRDQRSIEFLPAALEILERPPSPIGRWLGYSLIILFTLFVIWASIGKVDVVATAEGKIIPGGRIKHIQPMQMGVIKNIFVEEGQLVEKGQPLIELDQTLTGADVERLKQEHRFLTLNLLREQSLGKLLWMEDQEQILADRDVERFAAAYVEKLAAQYQEPIKSEDLTMQSAMAKQKWAEYNAKKSVFESQVQNRYSELAAIEANIKKYQSTIPLITKRVQAMQTLSKDGLIAEARLLELQEQQVSQQQNLIAEQARRGQVLSAIEEAKQNSIAQHNDARKTNLETIETLQQKVQSAEQELNKADELYAKQILYAPVTGRVQQLAVHTIGGVVKEAQALMQIVPKDRTLEVEAVLANKDIGFIHKGHKAEVKVHTFPFTKYGIINAEVIDITADAIESEKQGLVYKMRLKMESNQLWVDKRWVDLLPGMAVSAEVKTGKRKLIDFFISPLMRYKDESVRER